MKPVRETYGVKYYQYDIDEYPFEKLVLEFFEVENLENLLDLLTKEDQARINSELFTNDNDAHTELHRRFYKKLNSTWPEFLNVYRSFVKNFIAPILNTDEIIFQSTPSFRIQFPDNIAVGGNAGDDVGEYGWHRDSDPGYNHPVTEKNFIIPLTNSRETATVYIETFPDSRDYQPATMNVGEVFNFNGALCKHGNKKNITGKCRLSFDFRVVLPEDYDENYSKNSKLSTKKFIIGGYYDRI